MQQVCFQVVWLSSKLRFNAGNKFATGSKKKKKLASKHCRHCCNRFVFALHYLYCLSVFDCPCLVSSQMSRKLNKVYTLVVQPRSIFLLPVLEKTYLSFVHLPLSLTSHFLLVTYFHGRGHSRLFIVKWSVLVVKQSVLFSIIVLHLLFCSVIVVSTGTL